MRSMEICWKEWVHLEEMGARGGTVGWVKLTLQVWQVA